MEQRLQNPVNLSWLSSKVLGLQFLEGNPYPFCFYLSIFQYSIHSAQEAPSHPTNINDRLLSVGPWGPCPASG